MIESLDRHPAQNWHFLIIRGELSDIERVGIADQVIVERLAVLDKRLWGYRKIVVPQPEEWRKVQLLLQEYLVPIICSDCPDYINQCLADVEKGQKGAS